MKRIWDEAVLDLSVEGRGGHGFLPQEVASFD